MIHYIKQNTGRKKISYIGHSQGAIAMVNLAATQPEIADSLSVAIAWSVAAGHMSLDSLYYNIMLNSWVLAY